jgi:hypothetical protein
MGQHYISILVECGGVQGVLKNLRSSKDVNLNDGDGDSPSQEKLTGSDSQDLESGHQPRKRKTSQNLHSHGSFFLRVGAIGEFMHVRGSGFKSQNLFLLHNANSNYFIFLNCLYTISCIPQPIFRTSFWNY